MKAMIFAAGLGTRLKPITDTLPKALVPVCGKPLIEHVMTRLADVRDKEGSALIDGFVVNVHHFSEKITTWLKEHSQAVPVEVSDESARLLETGGAVLHARPYLEGCGSFLIHNVDIMSDCDLGWFASQVRPDALASLLVSDRPTTRFLLFEPDTMRMVGWMNTDTGDYSVISPSIVPSECRALAFSGIHIMSDRVFDLMESYIKEKGLPTDDVAGTRFPIMSFYMYVASKHPVYGVFAESLDFLDVGKLDAIAPAEEFVRKGL